MIKQITELSMQMTQTVSWKTSLAIGAQASYSAGGALGCGNADRLVELNGGAVGVEQSANAVEFLPIPLGAFSNNRWYCTSQ